LFDKFHITRHSGEALDSVLKSEYARVSGRERRYIKGQKYALLKRRENLSQRQAGARNLAQFASSTTLLTMVGLVSLL
jgi:hypothetical protein